MILISILTRDEANAVARLDNLEFLSDVVPRTTTYAKYTERRKKAAEALERAAAAPPTMDPHSPIQPKNPSHSRGPSGSGFSPSFQGPGSARTNPVNLLDDGEPMEVDGRPRSQHQYHGMGVGMGRPVGVPTTEELLERARAAQARAELGLSHSPSLGLGGSQG